MNLIRSESLVPKPWKNGGGVTREIDAEPPGASLDAFVWRLSIANVDAPGAFSTFSGIDRTLVLLEGAGMHLHEANGAVHALNAPLDMASFEGEASIDATLVDGPTRDFNVMVRRDSARAIVKAYRDESLSVQANGTTVVFCVEGEIEVAYQGTRQVFSQDDTLRLDFTPCDVTCTRPGTSWLHIGIVGTEESR